MKRMLTYILCLLLMVTWISMVDSIKAEETLKMIGEELLPPNAKPGECYARVFVPPTYRTVSERVLMKEASSRMETFEPDFEWLEEKVMIKAPSEKLEIIPAEFAWVEEEILIKPEHKHLRPVPPVYETVTERVLERPAHTIWKKGKGPIQRIDHATGEIMCLVEVPATYKTVTKQVLVKQASTEQTVTPAKYKTIRRKIMKNPPTVRKIEIPAEYITVKTERLVREARTSSIPLSAQYQTITRREKITEGRMEWQPILCETNTTPTLIYSLQKALKEAGYNPGPIDGDLGQQTMTAVEAYQKDKGLPQGQLTFETLKTLGIKF